GHYDERRHRGGESTERRRRELEKESKKERDKQRESTREKKEDDRYAERRKEGSRDRRGDKERREETNKREQDRFGGADRNSHDSRERRDRRNDIEKREERDRRERDRALEGARYTYDSTGRRDRKQDVVEKHERVKDKERHRDKEKERDARKEEKDKERRRHHRAESERRRQEESGEGGFKKQERDKREKHGDRERHTDEYRERKSDRERRERHSEGREDKGHNEEHRRQREEKERRREDRDQQQEKRRRDRDVASEEREGASDKVRHHRGDKERSERDRHREKGRHGREKEEGRGHRSSWEKAAAKAEDAAKTSDLQTTGAKDVKGGEKPVEGEEQVEQEYEDDFEEYEEDFEEMEESENEGEEKKEPQHLEVEEEDEEDKGEARARWKKEIEAIQRAMDEENSRVESAQSPQMSKDQEDERKPSRASEKSQTQAPHRRSFIDFVAAKQREVSRKVTAKQKKRSAELLRLIDLDFSVAFSVLDLPPVNQYDMYIRSFGTANTRQAYTQCNEDNVDRDVQTEETEISQRWTQHPPEHGGACGDPNLPWEAPNKAHSEIDFDSQRLTSFLQSASQVMVVLLEEEQAERESLRRHGSPADTMSFSDGSSRLNTGIPFLHGRGVSQVLAQRNTLMTVHVPAASHSDALLDDCTLICIWNIWEPSRPQKVLVYESEASWLQVRCCCFSPGKATLVFAGTSVGSVVLWDLRECASDHYRLTIEEEEWTFRQPTFSTDAVMASSGHFSPVTSIEAVPSAAAGELRSEVPLLASQEESSGLSFQLASLDETGLLNIWVVLEDLKANQAGSPSDLGLRPGGKVRLLHSSSILTVDRSSRDAATTGFFQTLHLKFLPTDSNHFFTGTNMGLVNHGTSHGLKATPRFYRFQEVGARPVDVTQIHFSPFKQHLFLVGCGDGSVRLHEVRNEQPVAEWRSSRGPVVALQWSHTRPGLFCVLDAASNFYIWDLLKSTTQPVITEKIHSDRVTAMAAFGDSGQNLYSGVVLAHQSGTIELQYFTAGFSTPSPAEVEKLESMVNQAF
ncbi:unnamed protein product, partial [Tetraodon nigroviridis]